MERPVCHFILDQVRSLHNVGSIFRTSDAFGIAKIWLCGITGTPPHREILKTALGATESVPWEHAAHTLEVIQHLKKEGFTIVAMEQTPESIPMQSAKPPLPLAIIFGHEIHGVSADVLNACDVFWEIPQLGRKQSMNVAVTAGMAAYHISLYTR